MCVLYQRFSSSFGFVKYSLSQRSTDTSALEQEATNKCGHGFGEVREDMLVKQTLGWLKIFSETPEAFLQFYIHIADLKSDRELLWYLTIMARHITFIKNFDSGYFVLAQQISR
jgi:hypothetical protein